MINFIKRIIAKYKCWNYGHDFEIVPNVPNQYGLYYMVGSYKVHEELTNSSIVANRYAWNRDSIYEYEILKTRICLTCGKIVSDSQEYGLEFQKRKAKKDLKNDRSYQAKKLHTQLTN